eukprot:2731-Eustigmatos_ZCMA.PRE.1
MLSPRQAFSPPPTRPTPSSSRHIESASCVAKHNVRHHQSLTSRYAAPSVSNVQRFFLGG